MADFEAVTCGELVIEAELPRAHMRPEQRACLRTHSPKIYGHLALPPCIEAGYCILNQLGDE